jgi:ACS family hexuronate transporter-like MFS transporter
MSVPVRHPAWKWVVCCLLLLATMLNYMDRLTVSLLSDRIIAEFKLSEKEYASTDAYFAVAFALGSFAFGWMADRWNVWWLYPAVLAAWSAAGALTGLSQIFAQLLAFRFLLGFTEAGHWPCALRTTQRIFRPAQRTLGNSILQSGAAFGSVATPQLLRYLPESWSWRPPFVVIGGLGIFWVLLWLVLLRPRDLQLDHVKALDAVKREPSEPFWSKTLSDRRFWILLIVVTSINSTWHFFRVWLPRLLQKTHGYSEDEMWRFTSAYYLLAGIGSILAGCATVWLVRRGQSVHGSRLWVFALCTLLTTLSFTVILLPTGPWLLAVLLFIGFGALGLFPPYYSFTQELSVVHQGKVTGLLGFLNWLAMAPLRLLEGYFGDLLGNYDFGLALAGTTPILGFLVLLFFWPRGKDVTAMARPG